MRDASEVTDLPFGLGFVRKLNFPKKIGILERIYASALSRRGISRISTYSGIVWKLDLRSATMRRAVFDEYMGAPFARWTRGWLRGGGVVLDSGANIGQTVMLFATCPNTKVLAIEPNPQSVAWLKECLTFYLDWDVEVIVSGLSDQPGKLELICPNFEGEQAAQATFRGDWYQNRQSDLIQVPVTNFDSLLQDRKIPRVRLWKLDVEGWESKVLQGARGSLEAGLIDALYIELHPSNESSVVAFLRACGYEFFIFRTGDRPVRCAGLLPVASDYLVIHRSLAAEIA